ncbi:MAG: helix-turn-helix transcriptional regulator [Rhizomicrobium sp.]
MTKATHLAVEESGVQKTRRPLTREIPADSDASLVTVGQELRAARQRRGEDLATVSNVLKIRKDHLEALEEDQIEKLPGRTYAVGFVRTYAEYLGLDVAASVARFKAQIAGRMDDTTPSITVIDEDDYRRYALWLEDCRWSGFNSIGLRRLSSARACRRQVADAAGRFTARAICTEACARKAKASDCFGACICCSGARTNDYGLDGGGDATGPDVTSGGGQPMASKITARG